MDSGLTILASDWLWMIILTGYREVQRDKERLREKELIAKTVPEPTTKN